MKKAVFLDRDGVINEVQFSGNLPIPPRTLDEVKIIDGVFEAIRLLKANNFLPIVITNQPDVARKKVSIETVTAINLHISELLGIKHIYTCMHDDSDLCNCRKPSSGLIEQSAAELEIDISKSFLVGDRWKDIAAGQEVGVPSFFIDYSYPEKQPKEPYIKVRSLLEAVERITGGSVDVDF